MGASPNLERFAPSISEQERDLKVCKPGTRFLAFLVDAILSGLILKASQLLIITLTHKNPSVLLLWSLVFPVLYTVLPLYASGQTLGKMIMKIQVVREDGDDLSIGDILKREFVGKFFSALVFLLGYVAILTSKDHRAWHDKWFKLRVISLAER